MDINGVTYVWVVMCFMEPGENDPNGHWYINPTAYRTKEKAEAAVRMMYDATVEDRGYDNIHNYQIKRVMLRC